MWLHDGIPPSAAALTWSTAKPPHPAPPPSMYPAMPLDLCACQHECWPVHWMLQHVWTYAACPMR